MSRRTDPAQHRKKKKKKSGEQGKAQYPASQEEKETRNKENYNVPGEKLCYATWTKRGSGGEEGGEPLSTIQESPKGEEKRR